MNTAGLLPPVVAIVLLVVFVEWWLTRDRPRSVPLMFANLWVGVFEQAMGSLVYVGLVAVYDRLTTLAPVALSSRSVLVWVVTILAVDVAFYVYHRFSHRTALGWSLHAVHHQSPELNAAAATRNSPLGGAVQFLFHIPLALVGLPTVCWVGAKGINTLWQLVLHTDARWCLPVGEGWVNSPSAHRLHHGVQDCYRDRNLGGVLLVWDRLFGTHVVETEPPRFGTSPALAHVDPVLAQLAPLRELVRQVRVGGRAQVFAPPRGDEVVSAGLPVLQDSPRARVRAVLQLAAALGLLVAITSGIVPLSIGVPSLIAGSALAAATSTGRGWAFPLDAARVAVTLLLARMFS